jgi:hypothetical protein
MYTFSQNQSRAVHLLTRDKIQDHMRDRKRLVTIALL